MGCEMTLSLISRGPQRPPPPIGASESDTPWEMGLRKLNTGTEHVRYNISETSGAQNDTYHGVPYLTTELDLPI